MIMRLARQTDLDEIRRVFRCIIKKMRAEGLDIWDDVYPCDFFGEDIEKGRLYIWTEDEKIAAAAALCESCDGADEVVWQDENAPAVYLLRFGVNAASSRRGLGSKAIKDLISLAVSRGARYLRLFVVDENEPAVRFYEKNGFVRAGGHFDEKIDDELTLREYGYEIRL